MSQNDYIVSLASTPKRSTGHSALQFLAPPDRTGTDAVAVMFGSLPASAFVPLHSHSEFESLYILRGTMEAYQDHGAAGTWKAAKEGDLIIVRSGVKHALRNKSSAPCDALIIAGSEVYEFLAGISHPFNPDTPPIAPGPEEVERMTALAKKFHQWMASPQENAAIGLEIS